MPQPCEATCVANWLNENPIRLTVAAGRVATTVDMTWPLSDCYACCATWGESWRRLSRKRLIAYHSLFKFNVA